VAIRNQSVGEFNGGILINKLKNINIVDFDAKNCFHAEEQLILVEEGSPHFLLWNCYHDGIAVRISLKKNRLEFDLAFIGCRDRPSPSLRMQDTCT
jgi:hypothetical protein